MFSLIANLTGDTFNSNNKMTSTLASDNQSFWDSITDERVNDYYLLKGGPSIILTICSIYLYFVLSLGPNLMLKHKGFKLNKILLIYNLGLAAANLWLFIQGLWVSNYGLDTLGCEKFGGDIRKSPKRGIYLGYLFFLTKLIELLDTVFFVLRKKKEQITFLHVFHHSIVPIFCWIGIKLAPGGPNGFFPLINSFIHVVMYFYYAMSTFGPLVKPYLWWKKYLTWLQMIQFILVIMATTFLILFAMFYRNAYLSKKSTSKRQTTSHQEKQSIVYNKKGLEANNNSNKCIDNNYEEVIGQSNTAFRQRAKIAGNIKLL